MGRSKAQDALQAKIEDAYPAAYVDDEIYIGKLLEERGYSQKEIERELGHHMHKLFVDIVMWDSDRTVAFEYHGEQHYSLVGNMTKTSADLLMNQQLDQEKSWILQRIGIPLVAVPFDMYVDGAVLEDLIDKATDECIETSKGYVPCEVCHRVFPKGTLSVEGVCRGCIEKARAEEDAVEEEAAKEKAKARRREENKKRNEERKAARKGSSWRDFAGEAQKESDYEKAQKEEAKRRRKGAYQAWKESPEYQKQKEEAKRRRKEAYQKAKMEQKRKKRES